MGWKFIQSLFRSQISPSMASGSIMQTGLFICPASIENQSYDRG
jgi:3-polyprenyl-4-hydroxybenzoate decarboxylase